MQAVAGHLLPRQLNEPIVLSIFYRWKQTYAQNTLYVKRRILRAFLDHLERLGSPHIVIPKVRPGRPRQIVATPEETAALLKNSPLWMRLFIFLCWHTALRFTEAQSITPRDYNAETHSIAVTVKGGKRRVLPITPEIEQLIEATLHGDPDTTCIRILHGGNIGPGGVRSAWCRLTKQLGLHNLNPHDLRRTTARDLLEQTKDLLAVQKYLGHESLTATMRYLGPPSDARLREYQRLLNFSNFTSEIKQ